MKRLSLKEKGFAKDFVRTKNATEAAVLNYNVKNRDTASMIGSQYLKKPRILKEVDRLMEEQDITDPFLMQSLKEGLKANYVASYKGNATKTDIPDHNIRHKFLQDTLKMKGWLKEQVDVRSLNIDVELENMSKGQIQQLLKGLLKENEKSIQTTNDQGRQKVSVGETGGSAGGDSSSLGTEHQAPGEGKTQG